MIFLPYADEPTKKKKCLKIDPSYIVLTKADSHLLSQRSVSYRSFKQKYSECSNMCKKMYFRNRLNKGKDVFNVKAPSKQKEYQLYLKRLDEEALAQVSSRKKRKTTCILVNDLLQKHDSIVKKRVKESNNKYLSRVRRQILSVPNDFKDVTHESHGNSALADTKIKLQKGEVELVKDERFKENLETLKAMIYIKRESNQKLRQLKRMKMFSSLSDPLTMTAGTKSLSGRIRKTNNRYSGDFATTKYDIDAVMIQNSIKSRLDYFRRKKAAQADVKTKLRNRLVGVDDIKMGGRVPPGFEIVVEGADDTTDTKDGEETGKTLKSKKMPDSDNDPLTAGQIQNLYENTEKVIQQTRQNSQSKAKRKRKIDGVIIQNMPNDDNVMQELLQGESDRALPSTSKSEASSSPCFSNVRSLLSKNQTSGTKAKQVDTSYEGHSGAQVKKQIESEADIAAKNKLLRIPKSVQKLFIKTQAKPLTVCSAQSALSNKSPTTIFVQRTGGKIATTQALSKESLLTSDKTKGSQAQVVHLGLLPNSAGSNIPLSKDQTVKRSINTTTPTSTVVFSPVLIPTTANVSQTTPTVRIRPAVSSNAPFSGQIPIVLNGPFPSVNTAIRSSIQSSQALLAPKWNSPKTLIRTTVAPTQLVAARPLILQHQQKVIQTAVAQAQQSKAVTHVITFPGTTQLSSAPLSTQTTLTSAPQPVESNVSAHEKGKFYLLKIDGKNFLIPIDSTAVQQKADILTNSKQTATTLKCVPSSASHPVCTTVAGTVSTEVLKPTAAIIPSVQHTRPAITNVSNSLKGYSMSVLPAAKPARLEETVKTTPVPCSVIPNTTFVQIKKEKEDPGYNIAEYPSSSVNSPKKIVTNTISFSQVGCKLSESGPSIIKSAKETSHKSNEGSQTVDTETREETKPVAFSEALTAREERLRRLKETLKQKQKAVEELRMQKINGEP